MFKNFFSDLKLNKISYLLEVIETGEFKKKVDAYNKLKKMKISEEAGHIIIDKAVSLKNSKNDDFNLEVALLSLIFENFYDSYSFHLLEVYKKLNIDSKQEILNILSNSNDPSQLVLYRTLISNYYKELKNFPIGNISSNKDNYELVFPELYETFKLSNNRNSLLILLSDFINQGVVPLVHLKKYKTVLQKLIVSIFKEGIKYKIDPKENFMGKKEYIDLRIFLEVAINIEFYISNKETKTYLDKLYKTKDNQLKLFILENYLRKEKNISKLSLTSIAKDNLSRYPLYSFLEMNKLQNLMPKKYCNYKDLSLSDLFINYSISCGYTKVPYDFELVEERIIDNYKYYIYKFKTEFNYNEEIIDPATDYLLKNIKIDKDLMNNAETIYVGISGGYNKDKEPSSIEKPLKGLKVAKLDGDYEQIVNKLLESEKEEVKEIIVKEKTPIIEKESKIAKFVSFSKILTFFSLLAILSFVVLTLYVNNVDLFNLQKNGRLKKANIIKAVLLKPKDLFQEINYNEIFNREDPEYYVLFFKKKDKSTYYEYLNVLLKNGYKIYYVDLSKKENKPIFEGNETGFVISDDTLLKVNDKVYSFYIYGKSNILKEFKTYVDEIIKKQEEEAKAKAKEEAKKEKRARRKSEESSREKENQNN